MRKQLPGFLTMFFFPRQHMNKVHSCCKAGKQKNSSDYSTGHVFHALLFRNCGSNIMQVLNQSPSNHSNIQLPRNNIQLPSNNTQFPCNNRQLVQRDTQFLRNNIQFPFTDIQILRNNIKFLCTDTEIFCTDTKNLHNNINSLVQIYRSSPTISKSLATVSNFRTE